MLFGSYRINAKKESTPRPGLKFRDGELNLCACSLQFLAQDPDDIYDWTAHVLNENWDEKHALRKFKLLPGMMACDARLNQNKFVGVGYINNANQGLGCTVRYRILVVA